MNSAMAIRFPWLPPRPPVKELLLHVPLCLDGLARESEVATALDIASGVTAEGCPVLCDQNPDESTQN
ncbi:hypothetical protein Peur_035403 [Populus x canadensis]